MTNSLLDCQPPQNPGHLNQLPTWQLLKESFIFNWPNWDEQLTLITWERDLLGRCFHGLMTEVYSLQDLTIDWLEQPGLRPGWEQAVATLTLSCALSQPKSFLTIAQSLLYKLQSNDQTLPTDVILAAPSMQCVSGEAVVLLPVHWLGTHFEAAEALLEKLGESLDHRWFSCNSCVWILYALFSLEPET